jgi:hypothetical protein
VDFKAGASGISRLIFIVIPVPMPTFSAQQNGVDEWFSCQKSAQIT